MRTATNLHINRGAALAVALVVGLAVAPVCQLGYALVLAKNMETTANGPQIMGNDTVANVSMTNGDGALALSFVQTQIIKTTI